MTRGTANHGAWKRIDNFNKEYKIYKFRNSWRRACVKKQIKELALTLLVVLVIDAILCPIVVWCCCKAGWILSFI